MFNGKPRAVSAGLPGKVHGEVGPALVPWHPLDALGVIAATGVGALPQNSRLTVLISPTPTRRFAWVRRPLQTLTDLPYCHDTEFASRFTVIFGAITLGLVFFSSRQSSEGAYFRGQIPIDDLA
jgi:hypothetical protein